METSAGGPDEYVVALRTSTDRARNLLYFVAVTTVLVFAVYHNIAADSWPRRRLDAWYRYVREDGNIKPIPQEVAGGDLERLKDLRSEYVEQFASRVVFAASPLPGVAMDVNDLPLVGGLALTLLMILSVTAIAREHETLYLALYKVRLICEEDGAKSAHGGSRANLLYHALAMTQMLNSPPTLARWKPRPLVAPVWRLAFLLPFYVYWRVLENEVATSHVSYIVSEVNAERNLQVYGTLAAALLLLGLVAWAHTSAMAERWDRAFLRINPQRRAAPQASIFTWLRIRLTPLTTSRLTRQQLTSAVVDALEVRDQAVDTYEVPVEVRVPCRSRRIRMQHVRRMREQLLLAGSREARLARLSSDWSKIQLVRFAAISSMKRPTEWLVKGLWTVKQARP
ncbi:MAG TPA: hypothetical protein VF266_26715 [Thermoanaerobaculia bacterium]